MATQKQQLSFSTSDLQQRQETATLLKGLWDASIPTPVPLFQISIWLQAVDADLLERAIRKTAIKRCKNLAATGAEMSLDYLQRYCTRCALNSMTDRYPTNAKTALQGVQSVTQDRP